jgi:hypothetical protein
LDRASKIQDVSDKDQRVQAFKKMITISNVHLKCGLFLSLDAIVVSNAKDMFLEISYTSGEDGAVHVPYRGYRQIIMRIRLEGNLSDYGTEAFILRQLLSVDDLKGKKYVFIMHQSWNK